MEVRRQISIEQIYEDLLAEHKASQQHLHSKEEALKIFQKQLRDSNIEKQRLEQEIKQLHSQLARIQVLSPKPSSYCSDSANPSVTPTSSLRRLSSGAESSVYDSERERYILELEEAQEKNTELFRQIQLLEDEKEELASERDYYSGKCGSLMKCLEEERKAKPPSHSALQTVMEENRQLKLELVNVEAEKDQALNRIERYKKAVERRKAKESAGDQGLPVAMGSKKQDLRLALRRISELESLANSLSESVKEKTISLSHQKRANKILASRVTELEHRLKVLEISGLWSSADSLVPELPDPLLIPDKVKHVFSGSTSSNDLLSTDTTNTLQGLNGSFGSMEDKEQTSENLGTNPHVPLNPFDEEPQDDLQTDETCRTNQNTSLDPFDEEPQDKVSGTISDNFESDDKLDGGKPSKKQSSGEDSHDKRSMVNLA